MGWCSRTNPWANSAASNASSSATMPKSQDTEKPSAAVAPAVSPHGNAT